jgi:hypothetical protein
MLLGEATVIAFAIFTRVAFLWYNVIGAVAVIGFGLLLSVVFPEPPVMLRHHAGQAMEGPRGD